MLTVPLTAVERNCAITLIYIYIYYKVVVPMEGRAEPSRTTNATDTSCSSVLSSPPHSFHHCFAADFMLVEQRLILILAFSSGIDPIPALTIDGKKTRQKRNQDHVSKR